MIPGGCRRSNRDVPFGWLRLPPAGFEPTNLLTGGRFGIGCVCQFRHGGTGPGLTQGRFPGYGALRPRNVVASGLTGVKPVVNLKVNSVADHADPMEIATGVAGSVWLARNAPSHQQWASLGKRARARLISRFRLISAADRPLAKEKVRPVKGVDGVIEIKTKRPALRALAFRDGNVWFVTHIIPKPKPRRLVQEAQRCLAVRKAHHKSAETTIAIHP